MRRLDDQGDLQSPQRAPKLDKKWAFSVDVIYYFQLARPHNPAMPPFCHHLFIARTADQPEETAATGESAMGPLWRDEERTHLPIDPVAVGRKRAVSCAGGRQLYREAGP